MEIRKILVPFVGAETSSYVLDVALALGRRFAAHVEVFHAGVDPRDAIAFVGEGMTAAMIEQIMSAAEQEGRQRAARASALFNQACAAAGVQVTEAPQPGPRFTAAFVQRPGREDEMMAERGRVADLIVAVRSSPEDEGGISPTLEASLRDTGRPVLVVGPEAAQKPFGHRIAVAWNGSIEAGRAVTAALPFLAAAERVEVLSVEEGLNVGPSGADAAEYLSWHGVAATARTIGSSPFGVGKALLTAIADTGADMLVVGAYTRGQMRRLIFGGVTREVLAGATVPLLMVH